jgi:hypothetical protein
MDTDELRRKAEVYLVYDKPVLAANMVRSAAEIERLRAALEKILYIRTISRLEPMTLDDAIKVAQEALTAAQ